MDILKVTSVEVPLFVTFHFINAYEEEDEDGRVTAVIADCCEHNADTTILDKLRLQNLRSYSGGTFYQMQGSICILSYYICMSYIKYTFTIHKNHAR